MKVNIKLKDLIESYVIRSGRISTGDGQVGLSSTIDGNHFSVTIGDEVYQGLYHIDAKRSKLHLDLGGLYSRFDLIAEAELSAAKSEQGNVVANLPGKVLKVLVKAGDTVKADQICVVLDAMKMEHSLSVQRDAQIEEVLIQEGDLVESDQLLVSLKVS